MGKHIAHRTWIPSSINGCQKEEPLRSPPIYTKVNRQAVLQNSELPWEEKFCLLGGIPWYMVLAAQKYMYCHENVLKWDDSAAKDALLDAQERFFAMINSLPYEHPLPDPDMYIDKIDWNPKIDPGLILDMDKEYCNPDEAENSIDNRISGCSDENRTTVDNPWESHRLEDNVDVRDLSKSWNKCCDSLELKNAMNSWEQCGLNRDEASKDKNDSGTHARACRKREDYQENTGRCKIQKHEGADSKSQQFWGKGRPQTRYNLRSSKY